MTMKDVRSDDKMDENNSQQFSKEGNEVITMKENWRRYEKKTKV